MNVQTSRGSQTADGRCGVQMNILYALCEWRLDEDNSVREHVRQQVRVGPVVAVCCQFASEFPGALPC